MKILGIIPARGGSKGIPQKNIINLCGKPLIDYSIRVGNQAVEKGLLEKVIVSTDDNEIADISKKLGACVPFIRPKELASDYSKSIDFVMHALEYYREKGEIYDAVLILQPTSPLRVYEDVVQAVRLFENGDAESLISCSEDDEFNSLGAYFIENNKTVPLDIRHNLGIRRQDYPKLYVRNGAIFITKVEYLINKKLIISEKPLIYVMPKERSSNIDTYTDLEQCRLYIEKRK